MASFAPAKKRIVRKPVKKPQEMEIIFDDGEDSFTLEFVDDAPKPSPVKKQINPEKGNPKKPFDPSKTYLKEHLQQYCRQLRYPVTGKKQLLIDYLTGKVKPKVKSTKSDIGGLALSKKNKDKLHAKAESIVSRLTRDDPLLKVSMNKQGNFEHKDTGIVFRKDHYAIGKQEEDGVKPLSLEDIELCKRMRVMFEIPYTLEDQKEEMKEDSEEELNSEDYNSDGEEDDDEED